MDTRGKIIDRLAAERLAHGMSIVAGYFDPLLASHAVRLSEIAAEGRPVLAVVRTPASPLLPAEARAELVASLAAVSHVVVGDDDRWIAGLPGARLYREEETDTRRREDLVRLVLRKQAAK